MSHKRKTGEFDFLYGSAYSTKQVADVCLNCPRPEPNCGEGCPEYLKAVSDMVNQNLSVTGGKRAHINTAWGVEFTYPQLAAAVGYSPCGVRNRAARLGRDAETLCRSYNLFNAADLKEALKKAGFP